MSHPLSEELRKLADTRSVDWVKDTLRGAADALDTLEAGGASIVLTQECTIANLRVERDELRRALAHKEALVESWRRKCLEARDYATRYHDALEWYADAKVYELNEMNGYIPDAHIPIFEDEGKRAREALKESGKG